MLAGDILPPPPIGLASGLTLLMDDRYLLVYEDPRTLYKWLALAGDISSPPPICPAVRPPFPIRDKYPLAYSDRDTQGICPGLAGSTVRPPPTCPAALPLSPTGDKPQQSNVQHVACRIAEVHLGDLTLVDRTLQHLDIVSEPVAV